MGKSDAFTVSLHFNYSNEWVYNERFKEKLNRRYNYYKSGGKIIGATDAKKEIKALVTKGMKN